MKLRKLIAILMVTAMVISMAGCGGNTASGTGDATTGNSGTENSVNTGDTTNATTNADGTAANAGDEKKEEQKANVELSLKELIESATVGKYNVIDGVTYQQLADDFGVEYLGANVSEETAFASAPGYFTSDDGTIEYEVGLFYFDGEGVKYGMSAYPAGGTMGESYTQATFELDGSFTSVMTNVEETAWASGQDVNTLGGCGSYLYDSVAYSLPEIVKALGLDKLDSNFLTTAEAIMAGQYTTCSGEFETEYGKATVGLSSFTVNTDYPTGYLSIKFADGSAPVKGVSFMDSYYGTFFDNAKHHVVSLSVGNDVF